jgi:hypothetical protein
MGETSLILVLELGELARKEVALAIFCVLGALEVGVCALRVEELREWV